MVEFNDPPQPVLTPLRNAVNFEERVSILLNASGSTYENPVVSSNYYKWLGTSSSDVSQVTYDDLIAAFGDIGGKGAALTVKFGLADSSETIVSANVRSIDTAGNQTSSTSIRSKFVKNTTNNYAYAYLYAGSDISPGTATESQRSFIDIKTNLGRSLRQQIYTQKAPSNTVTINGVATTLAQPAVIFTSTVAGIIPNMNFAVSFFPTWNDEIGRQHGSPIIGLDGQISKPYGGMSTVQVLRAIYYQGAVTGYSEFYPETYIREISSIGHQALSSADDVDVAFVFRSKKGSKHTVVFPAYLDFTLCVDPPDIDCPPIIQATDGFPPDQWPDGDEFSLTIPSGGASGGGGLGSSGGVYGGPNGETTIRVVYTGYKGGVINNGGVEKAVSDILAGTQTTVGFGEGSYSPTLSGSILDSDIIIAEAQNTNFEGKILRANSIVRIRGNTDIGLGGVPTAYGSYNFTTDTVSYTVTDLGWPGETVTISVKPYYGRMNPSIGSAQAASDLAIKADHTVRSVTQTVIGTYSNIPLGGTLWTEGVPDAVQITFGNSFGNSAYIAYGDEDPGWDQTVKKSPTIASASFDGVTGIGFNINDFGGQHSSHPYDLTYYIVADGELSAATSVGNATTVAEAIGVATTANYSVSELGLTSANNNDLIIFHIQGDQGFSNILKTRITGIPG